MNLKTFIVKVPIIFLMTIYYFQWYIRDHLNRIYIYIYNSTNKNFLNFMQLKLQFYYFIHFPSLPKKEKYLGLNKFLAFINSQIVKGKNLLIVAFYACKRVIIYVFSSVWALGKKVYKLHLLRFSTSQNKSCKLT